MYMYDAVINCSNGKYMSAVFQFDRFKKHYDAYDLLETYIKFTSIGNNLGKLTDQLHFYITHKNQDPKITFKENCFSINEFIEEISTNYPDFYKYDYSQIEPAIDIPHHYELM